MRKFINFTIYLCFLLSFCSFLILPTSNHKPKRRVFADVIPSELELKEYQDLEHGVATSTTSEIEDEFFKPTDTPGKNYTIVIDAGHGGPDPGSIGFKTKTFEADLNLKISNKLKEKLEDLKINVVMTRKTQDALAEGRGKDFKKKDMEMRKEIIKQTRPNMVISIHQNSYTNHSLHGAQVFYDKTSDISKQIAEMIQKEFQNSLNGANKCISPGDYYMLKCTSAPSIIVECGFLSNEAEEKLLLSEDYQDKIVNSICRGILNFLQIK